MLTPHISNYFSSPIFRCFCYISSASSIGCFITTKNNSNIALKSRLFFEAMIVMGKVRVQLSILHAGQRSDSLKALILHDSSIAREERRFPHHHPIASLIEKLLFRLGTPSKIIASAMKRIAEASIYLEEYVPFYGLALVKTASNNS